VQAWEILNHAARTIGIREKIGSHSLRKTFGYFAFKQGASLTLLMKVFGHSSEAITARYIGITQDDINQVYVNLNI
jgi:site-specific recombinase XerD